MNAETLTQLATFAVKEREALIQKSIAELTAAFATWNELMVAGDGDRALVIGKKIDSYRAALKDLGSVVD